MDLNNAIDILLQHIYIEKNEIGYVEEIFSSKNIDYTGHDSHLLADKLKNLSLFKVSSTFSQAYTSIVIYPNAKGEELVREHSTYSNYLKTTKEAEKKQNKLSVQDAKGSYLGGVAGVGSFVLALIALGYSIYNENEQEKINQMLMRRIEKLDKQPLLIREQTEPRPQNQQTTDSLGLSKTK